MSESKESNKKNEAEAVPESFLKRLWKGWIKPLGLIMIVLFSVRSTLADWNDVPSQSMEPTILVGDRIFVNKLAYDLKFPFTTWHLAEWSDPKRGDIVVFYKPTDRLRMVKRVIGVPGDTVELRNNRVLLNGKQVLLSEGNPDIPKSMLTDPGPFKFVDEQIGDVVHSIAIQPYRGSKKSFSEITVPDDHYLVLGDNRDNSGDFRVFGFVPRDDIVGKAVAVAISLDRKNSWTPRWGDSSAIWINPPFSGVTP